MATSIGNLPHATVPREFVFMTAYWLTGVYVSAIMIGQVGIYRQLNSSLHCLGY